MDPFHIAAGSTTGGQFAPAGGGSGAQTQQKPPAKKKPASSPQAQRAQLRAQAQHDLQQAKQLDQQAASLRQQISQMQTKLASLNRLHSTGAAKKPGTAAGAAAAAAKKPAAAAKPGTTAAAKKPGTSAASSTASQIASTKANIASLQARLKTIQNQAAQLRAQAAQLSSRANSIKGADVTEILEKAATLTGAGELTYVSFPIEKVEATDDGDLTVYGKATDGSVDSDEQIVDPEFSAKAIREWLESGGNVRVQHNPQRDPAGVGIMSEPGPDGSQWVKSLVIEPVAKRLVSKGALRAYSVGIAKPVIVRDSVARGGRITGGQIVEISLVDRPANKNCGIQLVKASNGDGHPEYVGKIFGADDVVAKAAGMSIDEVHRAFDDIVKTVTIELPEDVQVAFTPNDLKKVLDARKAAREPNVGEDKTPGGVRREDLPAGDFAGEHRSFPIHSPGDVSDAAQSVGRARGQSKERIKERIKEIAHRKGPEYEAQLPESYDGDGDGDGESSKAVKVPCSKCGKKGSGAFCKACGAKMPAITKETGEPTKIVVDSKGDKDGDGDGLFDADGDGDGAVAKLPEDAEKAFKNQCPKCHAVNKADATTCRKCGAALSAQKADGDGGRKCDLCDGSGKIREGHVRCPRCKGDGVIHPSDEAAEKADGADCPLCKGSGKIREGHVTCPKCKGSGKMSPGDQADAEKAQKQAEKAAIREALLEGLVEKVGPEGYVHGWIKVGGGADAPAHTLHGRQVTAQTTTGNQIRGTYDHAKGEVLDKFGGRHKATMVQAAKIAADAMYKGSGDDAGDHGGDGKDDVSEDGPKHSGDGMEEGLNVEGDEAGEGKGDTGDDHDDDDDGDHDDGDSKDDDGKDGKADKGQKIKPGGPKKGKKKAREFPPVKSMLPEGTPKADGPAVEVAGKPSGMKKTAKPTVGHGSKPVPEHREPDGPDIEEFEHDAGLPTVPDKEAEMKTAKWQRAIGVSAAWGALHDLMCPAYYPATAQKSHPQASLGDLIDPSEWQRIAMDKAATAPIREALLANQLWEAATELKSAEPELIFDLQVEAHKAFSDANPGPGQGLTPTHPMPAQFRRPYIEAGHAAHSPGHAGPNTATVPSGQTSAAQYQRGYLSAGHASESPSNHAVPAPLQAASFAGARTTPVITSMKANSEDMSSGPVGRPGSASRRFYTNAHRDRTKQAMKVLHDHISETFPDLCPMGGPSSPSAPTAAPNPVSTAKARKPKKDASDIGSLVKRLEKLVYRGEMSLEDARDHILKTQEPAADEPEMITKAAMAGSAGVSADILKAAITEAVEEATADLMSEVRKLRKRISSLEDGPDPYVNAWKGVGMTPPGTSPVNIHQPYQTSAAPAGMPTMTEVAERTQLMMMKELENQFRNSPDPSQREAAWSAICKMRGL